MNSYSGIKQGLVDLGGRTRTCLDLTSNQKVAGSSPAGCIPATSFNSTTYNVESASSSETSKGGSVTIV
jgi:hypothetical protein